MARSQESFSKKEKEKKRQKKAKEKRERREARKHEKAERGSTTLDDMIAYVDEFGNIVDTPPDPSQKSVIKAEDIVIGVPPQEKVDLDPIRQGIVRFFNLDKGYGFIDDLETNDSVFVHINNLNGPIRENDRVTFEVEAGPKGLSAFNVQLQR